MKTFFKIFGIIAGVILLLMVVFLILMPAEKTCEEIYSGGNYTKAEISMICSDTCADDNIVHVTDCYAKFNYNPAN